MSIRSSLVPVRPLARDGCAGPRSLALLVLAAVALLPACAPRAELVGGVEVPVQTADDARDLLAWMTGSFSSRAQAESDPTRYQASALHIVPIWTDRDDGWWLYVEQALERFPDRPYRQRIYKIETRFDGSFTSLVFELPGDPRERAGDWRAPERFADLAPEDLVPRPGCAVALVRDADRFVGGTSGTGCTSTLAGATYATSEVEITASGLETWDRGFDATGRQVWGATDGPYRFSRVREDASGVPAVGGGPAPADG